MTISEGFQHLSSKMNWYKKCEIKLPESKLKLPINENTARSLKHSFKLGKLGDTKMIDVLASAGYKITKASCEAPKEKKKKD